MADNLTKTHVPLPAIFQSDPLEQIYAKGTLDRDMSGLSYMFKNAAGMEREQNKEQYLRGVQQANEMARALNQQDAMSKMLVEALKQAPDYAKAGLPIANVPAIAQLFSGAGNDSQTAAASMLVNELKKSEIAKNYATGANAGAPEFQGETIVTPSGVSQESLRMKVKGGDSAMAQEMLRQRALAALKARGITGTGPGGTGLPNANPVDTRNTQEYLQNRGARWGN